jgi:hypothetical protein
MGLLAVRPGTEARLGTTLVLWSALIAGRRSAGLVALWLLGVALVARDLVLVVLVVVVGVLWLPVFETLIGCTWWVALLEASVSGQYCIFIFHRSAKMDVLLVPCLALSAADWLLVAVLWVHWDLGILMMMVMMVFRVPALFLARRLLVALVARWRPGTIALVMAPVVTTWAIATRHDTFSTLNGLGGLDRTSPMAVTATAGLLSALVA